MPLASEDATALRNDLLAAARDAELDPAREDRVSAEYSTLLGLEREGRLRRGAWLDLIHTDTFAGELAASMLKPILEARFEVSVHLHKVADLDVENPAHLRDTLGRFMSTVAGLLEEGEPRTTGFAALGGYKVMTSLAYVAGAYLGFPTVYLHENNQVIHNLPAVPVRFDQAIAAELASVIRKCIGARDLSSLSPPERELVKNHHYLFDQIGDDDEAVVSVNAFALFLRQRPELKAIIGTQVLFSTSARATWLARSVRVREELATCLKRVLREMERPEALRDPVIYYHRQYGLKQVTFNLGKGRHSKHRFAWRFEADHDRLIVSRLYDYDTYKADIRRGLGVRDSLEQDWHDLTAEVLG